MVIAAMATPEAVVHVDSSIFSENGELRKMKGKKHMPTNWHKDRKQM